MKKALVAVCIAVCAALALGMVLQASAVKLLRWQLARHLPGAEVTVSGTMRWGLFPPQIVLKDLFCEIKAPGRALAQIAGGTSGASAAGFPMAGRIVLERCRLLVHTADLDCDAAVSGVYDLARRSLERAEVSLASLAYGPWRVERAEAVVDRNRRSFLSVGSLAFDKLKVNGVSARVSFEGDSLVLSQGTAAVLGGTVGFDALLPTRPPWAYQATLRLKDIDVAVLVNDFEWQEKVKASGLLDGAVSVDAGLGAAGMVHGRMLASPSGGEVSVLDQTFLENLARWSKQPVGLISESFREYRYQSGSLTVDSQGSDLVLEASLSGAQGKRDLTIVVHR